MNTYKVLKEFKGEKVEGQEVISHVVGEMVEMEETDAAGLVESGTLELVTSEEKKAEDAGDENEKTTGDDEDAPDTDTEEKEEKSAE